MADLLTSVGGFNEVYNSSVAAHLAAVTAVKAALALGKASSSISTAIDSSLAAKDTAVDGVMKEATAAAHAAGKLQNGTQTPVATKWLNECDKIIHKLDKDLTQVINKSSGFLDQALKSVDEAKTASNNLAHEASTGKTSAILSNHTLSTLNPESVRVSTSLEHSIKAASNGTEIAGISKNTVKELNELERLLKFEKLKGIPQDLQHAQKLVQQTERDITVAKAYLSATDKSRTEWMTLKIHLEQLKRALHNYESHKPEILASDHLAQQINKKVADFALQASKAARGLLDETAKTIEAVDPVGSMALQKAIESKAATINVKIGGCDLNEGLIWCSMLPKFNRNDSLSNFL